MSVHYDKFLLGSYRSTPYFEAHRPAGFPVERALQYARARRFLPPNLLALADLSRRWSLHNGWRQPEGRDPIDKYYDREGYELSTDGHRLTDEEILAEWTRWERPEDPGDIPLPPGGFPDPLTWQPPVIEPGPDLDPEAEASDRYTFEQALRDLKTSRQWVFDDWRIPSQYASLSDEELARLMILGKFRTS